ncbi:hypothetical protein LPH52_01825 [Xylella taiwanensis]|nr:hypothetical protein [Xylella taiwanensis]MCD8455604.1 hypothetical protein [Xylella taiwanensis]
MHKCLATNNDKEATRGELSSVKQIYLRETQGLIGNATEEVVKASYGVIGSTRKRIYPSVKDAKSFILVRNASREETHQ